MLSAHLSRTEIPPNIEPLYTTEQVARLLRVSQRCVQVWIRDGVLPGARCGRGPFGMRVIFPCWGSVQQSSHYWAAKAYFEVIRKQRLIFPSGKPLSGHPPTDKPLKTINGHLE